MQIIQGVPRLRWVYPNGVGPYTVTWLYKNGAAVAISDGTNVDNGDGSVTVSWDAVDTDTVGDFSFQLKDSLATTFTYGDDEVIPVSLGLLANDGTGTLALQHLLVNNNGDGNDAVVITTTNAGERAIHIVSADDGILVDATGRGIALQTSGAGIAIISATVGIGISANDGVSITVGDVGVYVQSGAFGNGVVIDGQAGAGVILRGGGIGLSIRNSLTGPPLFPTTALDIASANNAVTIQSSSNNGVIVHGALDGVILAGTTGNAVTYQAVEMSLAFALKLLDFADSIDVGFTVRQTLRIIGAAAGGLSFLMGATRTYSAQDQSKTRITATTDNQGQRTAVTLDGT